MTTTSTFLNFFTERVHAGAPALVQVATAVGPQESFLQRARSQAAWHGLGDNGTCRGAYFGREQENIALDVQFVSHVI